MTISKTCDYNKLLNGIYIIQNADLDLLRNNDFVADTIRKTGLSYDPRQLYGSDNIYMNNSRFGLWQIPMQLAKCLVLLSEYEINSLIDIGTFKGWTISIVVSYLRRFNPSLQALTIDPVKQFKDYPIWKDLNLSYSQCSSEALEGQPFDLCFIDGEHSYAAINKDYQNLGRHAKICVFHDINEELCPDVAKYWQEMKKGNDTHEFLEHSEQAQIMGIGVMFH